MSCYTGPEIKLPLDQTQTNYLFYLLCALLITKTITLYIDWRQLKKYCEAAVHPYLTSVVKAEEFTSSQQYNFEKHMFGMLHECFDTVVDLWFIYSLTYASWWQ